QFFSYVNKKMSFRWSLLLLGVSLVSSRLVFPPHSDLGYLVKDIDEPEDVFDLNVFMENWNNSLENRAVDINRSRREGTSQLSDSDFNFLTNSLIDEHYSNKASSPGPMLDASLLPESMKDDKHGVVMGVANHNCDDGKTNLNIDWDFSPVNYTCYIPKSPLTVQGSLQSVEKHANIPADYSPLHKCMDTTIEYNTTLPTYHNHRPLWPVFGEYQFVPRQRWLHNVEHGAVILLYHPCAEPILVHRLRKIVTGCIRKHIITPYTLLTEDRPLALVAWGVSLEMATVNTSAVKKWIKDHGLKGPEGKYAKEGSYTVGLIKKAKPPTGSDINDKVLCPL
ncbi:unnamed protein product, partial [Meganyctiphanes norvegica]